MTVSVPTAYFITHPDVLIDPAIPVPDWPLSQRGRERIARIIMLPWVGGIRAAHALKQGTTQRRIIAEALARSGIRVAARDLEDRPLPRRRGQAAA